MKEGLEEDLDRLKSRKDDMLTLAEIGVDQLIVDQMQEFRKLSFATNQTTLKGIDADGSQRAWDLYVKTRFIDATKNPGRALVAASGTPITNSLAELFTLQRFIQPEALAERGRNSTPGRPISGRRGPSSNCSRPASTSRSRASANSSTSPTSWRSIGWRRMSSSSPTCGNI
jgi:hypothetical protein